MVPNRITAMPSAFHVSARLKVPQSAWSSTPMPSLLSAVVDERFSAHSFQVPWKFSALSTRMKRSIEDHTRLLKPLAMPAWPPALAVMNSSVSGGGMPLLPEADVAAGAEEIEGRVAGAEEGTVVRGARSQICQ